MNSFRLTAVGEFARNQELTIKGDITFARFCLVGNDEVAEDERGGPREVVTNLWCHEKSLAVFHYCAPNP